MYTLSIDIGKHNLGYALLNKVDDNIEFGLIDIDSNLKHKNSFIVERAGVIYEFVRGMFDKYSIDSVIIEKQMRVNVVATEIMNLFVGILYPYCQNIILFQPKHKFTRMHISYTTKYKAHKRLSIDLMRKVIEKYYPSMLEQFDKLEKKDDVADSLFMILVQNKKYDMIRAVMGKEATQPEENKDAEQQEPEQTNEEETPEQKLTLFVFIRYIS